MWIELDAVLELLLVLVLLHGKKFAIWWDSIALVPDLSIHTTRLLTLPTPIVGRLSHELRVIVRASKVQIAIAG